VLFWSAGVAAPDVPDGDGLVELLGGMCAPDPVGSPDPDAEADGAFEDLPVLSR
jgi:hypothetical protein